MENKELLKAMSDMIDSKLEPIIKDIQVVKSDTKGITSTLEEHTQLLRALEDRTKVTQSEVENLKHSMAETQGTLKRVETSVEKLVSKQDFLEDATANNWNQIREMKKKQA